MSDSPRGTGALERWTRRDRAVADARLVFFIATLVLAFVLYRGLVTGTWWLAVPAGAFVALVLSHEPIRRAADRARRAVDFYGKGLARLEGRWAGQGVKGLEFLDVEHPYAADLDLFGEGSLFERLCTARMRAGEEALAGWLLGPASIETIRHRHAAVAELRPALDLREDLELLGVEVRGGIDPTALAAWGRSQREFPRKTVSIVAAILAVLGTAALVGWLAGATGLFPLLVVLALDGGFAHLVSKRVGAVLAAVDQRTHDLVLLSELLSRLERERFEAPLLQKLVKSLETDGLAASAQIHRLARLLNLLDYQRNQLFMPLAFLWHWQIQISLLIDAWRARTGPRIGQWLAAIGEFEALCAMACYAAENPSDPFAEIVDGPACVRAEAVGHPLLAVGVMCSQRCHARRGDPGVDGERIEHVGEEHPVAHRGDQRRHGPCRCPGAGGSFPDHAGRGRWNAADPGFAAGGPFTFLRRDHPGAPDGRPGARAAAALVPLRRTIQRHQFARSLCGCRRRRPRPD